MAEYCYGIDYEKGMRWQTYVASINGTDPNYILHRDFRRVHTKRTWYGHSCYIELCNSRLSTDGTKSRSTQITCDSNTAATDASTAAAGYIAYAAFFESLTETSPAAIKSSATRSLTAI